MLSVVNHPTEGARYGKEELEALKERGVTQIKLVVSYALQGIENAVCAFFLKLHINFALLTLNDKYLIVPLIKKNHK